VTTIVLSAYPYEAYLREKLDARYNFDVVWIDRAAYEASNPQPQPRTFKAVVLENQYLSLWFLPELGGRLYKCTVKSTGQNIFYQNPVLKPSYWGPLAREENWWLAAGGMEWALPVHEHGYESGVFWAYNVQEQADAVSITLRDQTAEERTRDDRLWAEVTVTLPAGRAYFVVQPRLLNPTSESVTFQFWLNAALTLGSTRTSAQTEFIYPTERMIVHSTGDAALPGERESMSWPICDGRDLSLYGNWRNWLGVFVPEPRQGYAGAYNHETGLGVARIFEPAEVRGLKLFAFGADFPARPEYTDDGSDYFEIWAGPCKTFWPEDDVTLGPGQSLEWREVWWPFTSIGGLDTANAEIVLRASVQGNHLNLGISASRARRVQVRLAWNGAPMGLEQANVAPGAPMLAQLALPEGAIVPGELAVEVQDENGAHLLAHERTITP
jgi:hypothetical protein